MSTTCARCGDEITWCQDVLEVPGEWHHHNAADDNDLSRCPNGDTGYPAPVRHIDAIRLEMGERNLIVSALNLMLWASTTALATETTDHGRQVIFDVYGDPQVIRDVRDHVTHGDTL